MQFRIAATIALERSARRVEREPVDLDNEAVRLPDEIDLIAAQPFACLRIGQPAGPHQRQKPRLGLGAGERRPSFTLQHRSQAGAAPAPWGELQRPAECGP
jgi:hypothetical protein